MRTLSFILFVLSLTLISCSNDESTKEEEQARLDKMYQEIIDYAQINSTPCTNPEEWTFMKFTPSNCSGYIVYNKKIDVEILQKKINKYNKARGKFDAKWGIYYLFDCAIMPPPKGVACVESKPVLIYNNFKQP